MKKNVLGVIGLFVFFNGGFFIGVNGVCGGDTAIRFFWSTLRNVEFFTGGVAVP